MYGEIHFGTNPLIYDSDGLPNGYEDDDNDGIPTSVELQSHYHNENTFNLFPKLITRQKISDKNLYIFMALMIR